jgi:lactate permease
MAGLASSLAVAMLLYHMPPRLAVMAALNGAAYGLFPIGWIVLCAIFVYDITVQTGQFDLLRQSVAGLADDRRIQAILIAFCFGAFIEGAAGFGTPVAICAAMLIGLGFKPLPAAGLALIGNTAPVAFGSLGTPILALAKVTGIPATTLSIVVGRQLPIFSLVIPFWITCAMAGWRGMFQVWPACLTAGLSFAIVQFTISNHHGPWLVDVAAALASMAAMLVLLRFWQPRVRWRFDHDEPSGGPAQREPADAPAQDLLPTSSRQLAETANLRSRGTGAPVFLLEPVSARDAVRVAVPATTPARKYLVAWTPWLIVSVVIFVWGIPSVKSNLNRVSIDVSVAMLHNAVFRAPPVVAVRQAEPAIFTFNWLSATGSGLLLAAILSGSFLGLGPATLLRTFARTLRRVRLSLLTIAAMLAIGFTTRYAGLDATLGLAFASTGKLFPFFSPLLGWLGVALTGSDTSSNVLFGNLQQITAGQLGFPPVLAAAANSSGGVMGKMIDAQSIVVASIATGQSGGEGRILRYVFLHSLTLAVLVGLLVLAQAYGWVRW